jgi:hypothetical protein
MRDTTLGAISSLVFLFVLPISAAEGIDKSQYHLFNPTPAEQMRPMVSDQSMFTLTPITLDAGHYQLETDLFDYYHDHEKKGGADVLSTGWTLGRMTMKAGLLDRADLEVSFWAYSELMTKDKITGTKTVQRGISNLTLSSKINLWGNEGGMTSLALLPYVSFPTTQLTPGYDDFTGGLIVPFWIKCECGWRLGLNTGVDVYPNAANDLQTGLVNGISLRGPLHIVDKLDIYGEFFTTLDTPSREWTGVIYSGLAYQLTENIEIHAGATFGVHNETDYNPYFGFSWRF